MASFRLTAAPKFPENTIISAYSQLFWGGAAPTDGETPRGSSAGVTAVVDAHGFALFEGLAENTGFYFGALVSSQWRWLSGRTPSENAAGSGSGTPGIGALEASLAAESATRAGADSSLNAAIAALSTQTGLTEEQVKAIVETFDPVTSKIWPMGSVTGAVTPDLRKGRIFTIKSTGPLKLKPPSNPPASASDAAIEALIVVEGKEAIELVGITWTDEALAFDLSSSSSINYIPLESLDAGATWHAIGTTAPPANVPRVNGTPTDKQGLVWDAGTETWKPGTLFATAAAEAAAETVVVAKAVQNSSAGALIVTGTNAAGMVPYGTTATNMTLTSLASLTAAKLALAELSTNTTLAVEHYYRYTGAGNTLTMPTPGATISEGQRIVIENASGGVLKVKGRFTFGSETETTLTMHTGEVLTFVCTSEGKLWRPTSGFQTPVQSNEAALGGYQAITLPQRSISLATPATKTIHIAKFMVPSSFPFTKLSVYVGKTGTLTYAAACVILSSNLLVAFTADEHVAWESTGVKTMSVGGGAVAELVGGLGVYAYFAILCVGSAMPELGAATEPSGGNQALSAALSGNSAVVAGEARNTAGETAVYTTLEPPTTVDLSKSRGKSNNFPLFWGGLS